LRLVVLGRCLSGHKVGPSQHRMAPTWVKHKGREPFAPIPRSASYLEVVGGARPHDQHSCKNDGGIGISGSTRGDDVDEKACVDGASGVNDATDDDSDSAHESVDVSTTTESDDGEPDVASVRSTRSSLMAIGLFIVHDVSESCRVLQRAPTSSYPAQCLFTAPLTCSAIKRACTMQSPALSILPLVVSCSSSHGSTPLCLLTAPLTCPTSVRAPLALKRLVWATSPHQCTRSAVAFSLWLCWHLPLGKPRNLRTLSSRSASFHRTSRSVS
jgi:hypothetical protein